MRVNARAPVAFFETYLDEREDPYPQLDAMMRELEIPVAYDASLGVAQGFLADGTTRVILHLQRKSVVIGDTTLTVTENTFRLIEGKLYIHYAALNAFFPLEATWDLDAFRLRVITKYPLPSEERQKRLAMRRRLDEQRGRKYRAEDLEREVPWFDPGMFELKTTVSGGKEHPDGTVVNLQGVHRFLKGDLEYSLTHSRFDGDTRARVLDFARLTYYDPLRTKQLQLGDTFTSFSPLVLDTVSIRGGSFFTGGRQLRFGRTTLIGTAPPNSEVDLFRLGVLVDFTTVDEKGFYTFTDLPLSVKVTLFEARIFTPTGRQITQFHEVASQEEMLEQGEFASIGGAGHGERAGGEFTVEGGEVRYGLLDWLTLGGYVLSLDNFVVELDPIQDQTTSGAFFLLRPFNALVLLGERAQASEQDGAATRWDAFLRFADISLEIDQRLYDGAYDPPNRTRATVFSQPDVADDILIIQARARYFATNISFKSTLTDFGETRLLEEDTLRLDRRFPPLFSLSLALSKARSSEDGFSKAGTDAQELLAITRISNLTRLEFLVRRSEVIDQATTNDWQVVLRKNQRLDSPWSYRLSHTVSGSLEPLTEAALGYLFSHRFRVLGQIDNQDRWLAQVEFTVPFRVSGDGFETLPAQTFGRAGLTGTVFVDDNGNGVRDPGEDPMSDVSILAPGIRGLESDENGRFRGWGLPTHGVTDITLDLLSTDALYTPARKRVAVAARPGEMVHLDVPLVPAGGLEGLLRMEQPLDVSPANGLEMVLIRGDGSEESRSPVEFDGSFVFESIPPGVYQLYPDPEQLEDMKLTVQPARQEVVLTHGKEPVWLYDVEFQLEVSSRP